ncbi:MAG: hypothetical protein VX835_03345 [Pseudomonadota bacterium]|nr:hypothetical protein [Pseudomonadota bacterium]
MKQMWLILVISVVLPQHLFAQEVTPFLETKVATHQYHGDGAETNDPLNQASNTDSVEKVKLTQTKWLDMHIPEIFSEDHINFSIHDQMINKYFNDSGLKDYSSWQKKQIPLLIRHQFIVKATLADTIQTNPFESDQNEKTLHVNLMFHGYDSHLAKKVEVIHLTVKLQLMSHPTKDWVISKMSVEVNDDRKQNQNPA